MQRIGSLTPCWRNDVADCVAKRSKLNVNGVGSVSTASPVNRRVGRLFCCRIGRSCGDVIL
jgi:hypothetical protein